MHWAVANSPRSLGMSDPVSPGGLLAMRASKRASALFSCQTRLEPLRTIRTCRLMTSKVVNKRIADYFIIR